MAGEERGSESLTVCHPLVHPQSLELDLEVRGGIRVQNGQNDFTSTRRTDFRNQIQTRLWSYFVEQDLAYRVVSIWIVEIELSRGEKCV